MNRPFIFCHMLTSIDGKIMGKYMDSDKGEEAGKVFYEIAFGEEPFYKHQGWLSGRVTTDDNFTFYEKPNLDENVNEVPQGDFIAEKSSMNYVSVDPSGKLGWKSNILQYEDTTAHIIEVLTEKASPAYKAFLRKLGISYIIAGKDELNKELALKKLKELFGIETLMLGGGAALNWSFIQDGLCDELSLVIAASADGSSKTQTLFMQKNGLSTDNPISFTLIDAKKEKGSSLWLRYSIDNAEDISD